MKMTKWKMFLAGFFCLSVNSANASVITSGCTLDPNHACSLAELMSDPLSYIQVDGARFKNFFYLNIPFSDASRIRVEAIDSAGNGNQAGSVVGLKFTAIDGLPSLLEAFSLSTYSVLSEITYELDVLSGLPIGASSMLVKFGDYVFSSGIYLDGGLRTTIERGSLAPVQMAATCNQVAGPPSYTCQNAGVMASKSFGPVYNMSVTNDLFIDHVEAFGGKPDGMQILNFQQYFTRTVPEPGTWSIFLMGLLAFGLGRRKLSA